MNYFATFSNSEAPVLLGAFASFPLFGVTIAQTIWYFRRYPEDPKALKYSIATLLIIETIETFGTAQASMSVYLRDRITLVYPLGILLELFFTTVSVGIVQGVYTYRVWIMSEKNRRLVCALSLLMMSELVFGTAFNILQSVNGDASRLHTRISNVLGTLGLGSGMACDILISASLVYHLNKWRSETRRYASWLITDNLIDRIVIYVVGVGVATSAFSALVFITWLTLPRQCIFMLFFSILSKLYVNSLLVTLNARTSLRNKYNSESEYKELE